MPCRPHIKKKPTNRQELIKSLKRKFAINDDIGLMNKLQDEGLVSDEAVTIEDVYIVYLTKAYESKEEQS